MSALSNAYVVRRWPAGRAALRGLAGLAMIVLVLSPIGGLFSPRLPAGGSLQWVFLAMTAFFAQGFLRQQTRVLRVDRRGVELARTEPSPGARRPEGVRVPWRSIAAIVVAEGSPGWIGIRLRPGAPLPLGLQAIVEDPANPSVVAPGLRQPIASRTLDQDRLLRAVRAFAPQVEVVDVGLGAGA